MLQSQLFGRALDLSKKIPTDTLESTAGVTVIVNAVFSRDPLAAVSTIYQLLLQVLNTKCGASESFQNFESRFCSITADQVYN